MELEDPVVMSIGSWGRWQAKQSFLLSMLKLPIAWFQLQILFMAPPQPFWCEDSSEPTLQKTTNNVIDSCGTYSNKSLLVECKAWSYNRSVFTETIVSEWDLVCSRNQIANVAQLVLMLGVLMGNVLFGGASDRWGRRAPLLVAIVLQAAAGLGAAFVPWLSGFMALRFLVGFATGGTMVVSFVMCMEIVGGKWRTVIPILYQIPFGIGVTLMAGGAYHLRHWRDLQLALACCSLPFVSYYWLVPESPRWLLAVGRENEAISVLEAAAKVNGLNVEQVKAAVLKHKMVATKETHSRGSLGSLLRTPRLRRTSLCLFFMWFAVGLSFFGFSQFQGQIGDIFMTVTLSGIVSVPGPLLCVYTVSSVGRRNSILLSVLLSSAASLLILTVPLGVFAGDWPRAFLASLAVLGMSVAFPALYLYSGELLPTIVRNIGLGASSMCARLGSMAAPFVLSLGMFGEYVPVVALACLPLIGALLILPLPETKDCVLPESLEDGENFCRRRAKEDMQNANYIQVPMKDNFLTTQNNCTD